MVQERLTPRLAARRRFKLLEELQERVVTEINAGYFGRTVEVLVEANHKGKWKGRTRTNKLVFFDDAAEWSGRTARVTITQTSPWSLQGAVASQSIPLPVVA